MNKIMKNIDGKTKLKIFVMGFLFSLLGVLMLWALLARVINDLIVENISNANHILLIIILGLFGITFAVSIVFGILLTEDIDKRSVLAASGVAILPTFIVILGLSYFGLALVYPEIYSELQGLELLLAFPSVLVYFSIYVMQNYFLIYLITIVIYYLFFLVFLETFYEFALEDKYYEDVFKQFEIRRF